MKIKISRRQLMQVIQSVREQRIIDRPKNIMKLRFTDKRSYDRAKRVLNKGIKTLGTPKFDYRAVDGQDYITVRPGRDFRAVKGWLENQGITNYKIQDLH